MQSDDGNYTVNEVEDQGDTLQAIIRYQRSEAEVEEMVANGGFPSANTLVTGMTVDKTTGIIEDYEGNKWALWE
ncbi:hypothetical protein LQZ18_00420 [Lachnospiraceae bacterium ZAX-1]